MSMTLPGAFCVREKTHVFDFGVCIHFNDWLVQ